ncbi:MAG: DNA-protecting protein DprA [Alphaproteobacteria bacterium]|nr:DNA-protecting protein DprA [Alphaproteobacteria bacterium]
MTAGPLRPPASESERLAWLRLARSEGVGPVGFRRLLGRFGSAEAALRALPNLARAASRAATPHLADAEEVAAEAKAMARLGGRFIYLGAPDYPPALALLDDAPPVLGLLGGGRHLLGRAVAIVGARNASANGRRIAAQLAEELARAGITVVSGLARGIDAAAHEAALGAGITVAAVAGGLDTPYPPENAPLQVRIAATGAVLSEVPLGTAPQARHFPRRNRLIAGLSLGVVVVEAAPRSGSLITARMALDYGREVFAVPGSPLDPRCRGSNDLLRQGAILAETAEDVLRHLPEAPSPGAGLPLAPPPEAAPRRPARPAPPPAAPAAAPESARPAPDAPPRSEAERARAALGELLGPHPVAVDEIIRQCQLSPAAVAAALLELDLAGRLERLPGNRVALIAGPGR